MPMSYNKMSRYQIPIRVEEEIRARLIALNVNFPTTTVKETTFSYLVFDSESTKHPLNCFKNFNYERCHLDGSALLWPTTHRTEEDNTRIESFIAQVATVLKDLPVFDIVVEYLDDSEGEFTATRYKASCEWRKKLRLIVCLVS